MAHGTHDHTNAGPNGGQYRNQNNHLSDSGQTDPAEGTHPNGEFMAAMGTQGDHTPGGSESQAPAETSVTRGPRFKG